MFSSSDGEKVYKRKKTADREIFSLGLPLLLFPIIEDFIKSRIKCGFHTFLKKGEDFCLKGVFLFLLFSSVSLIAHYFFTLLSKVKTKFV